MKSGRETLVGSVAWILARFGETFERRVAGKSCPRCGGKYKGAFARSPLSTFSLTSRFVFGVLDEFIWRHGGRHNEQIK